jgi:hypothetical protein
MFEERTSDDGALGAIFDLGTPLERCLELGGDRCGNTRHRAAPIGSADATASRRQPVPPRLLTESRPVEHRPRVPLLNVGVR